MFLYELKALRKSTITWTISILALAALYLSIYPSIVDEGEEFRELLGSYPEAVRMILGINLDYITSLLGFYSFIFTFIILCGAIQAMNLGVSILSKEGRERTADFLLVKPVSRTSIVSAKLLAALTTIILTNTIYIAVSLLLANIIKLEDFSNKLFVMVNLTMFFVQVIFIAVGMFVSMFFKKIKNVLPISLGLVFGFYFIGAFLVADSSDKLERMLSPFKYFDVFYILDHGSYESFYMMVGAVVVIVTVAASYLIYKKKDIHAVS
jgi:ABC-2 type transport system permease protein